MTFNESDPDRLSELSINEVDQNISNFPKQLPFTNDFVSSITAPVAGVISIKCKPVTPLITRPLVLSGGIHGDERAGVVILDKLAKDIMSGDLSVFRDVVLIYGNLRAMSENGGNGVRCVEEEVGVTANLNRCFGNSLFGNPQCYAEYRANQIMKFLHEVDMRNFEAIDIHQSFKVPYVSEVRGKIDRTEYTYAMLYPHDIDDTLKWIHESYSDIVAGAVINDMSIHHNTFAGYMAREFGASSATFEQGTIGNVDWATFTPQLFENLCQKVSGVNIIDKPLGFDTWEYVNSIIRRDDDFAFLDASGNDLDGAPTDFIPIGYKCIARNGDERHHINDGERLLFGNAKVPIGDRAAAIIREYKTSVVPGHSEYFT